MSDPSGESSCRAASIRKSRGRVLPLLQAVQHEFHATGNAQFFENPEEIVAHDSGSMLLGFSIAFLGLDLYRASGTAKSPLLFPLLIAAVPLLDACFAVFRRMRSREPLFNGDRRHIYDLLLTRGWTARRVALTCYGVSATLAVAALIVMRLDFAQALFASGLIVLGMSAAAVQLGALRSQDSVRSESKKETSVGRWRLPDPRRARQKTWQRRLNRIG